MAVWAISSTPLQFMTKRVLGAENVANPLSAWCKAGVPPFGAQAVKNSAVIRQICSARFDGRHKDSVHFITHIDVSQTAYYNRAKLAVSRPQYSFAQMNISWTTNIIWRVNIWQIKHLIALIAPQDRTDIYG